MQGAIKGPNDIILGRYVIDEMFESMEIVYRVHHRDDHARQYIAKRINPAYADRQELLDWFARQAKIWQQLTINQHPHLVWLIEPLRPDTDGAIYFFIEYVKGKNLHKIIPETTNHCLSYPQTLRWAVQIAAAMEFVSVEGKNHQGIFVHRDLDSSNIMISEKGIAKVNDWGIGKNSKEEDLISFMSMEEFKGGAVGKPVYMPPEQFPPGRGREYEVTGDVYYFGGLLFEMLTGKFVNPEKKSAELRSSNVSQDEVWQCLGSHHQQFVLKELRKLSLPEGFVQLVMNCIKVDHRQRIDNFTKILSQLIDLCHDVRSGMINANFVACRNCSFIASEIQTTCPVCRYKDQFARWDPSTFEFAIKIDKTISPEPGPTITLPPPKRINELIRIPAAAAILGANDECLVQLIRIISEQNSKPERWIGVEPRTVNLPEFFIARHAVSNEEYREFVEATKWREPKHWQEKNTGGKSRIDDKLPVVNVNFMDAEAFCQWKKARLPANDEWERAARGTDGRTYPWGNEWIGVVSCNTSERHKAVRKELAVVTEFLEYASPDGPLNMAGNVWEWVDGGEEERKHLRGGSWQYLGELYSVSWFRMPADADLTNEDVGFRYAQDGAKSELTPPGAEDLKAAVLVLGGAYQIGVTAAQIGSLIRKHRISAAEAHALSRSRRRSVRINSFQLRKYLVTNEEYYQFVQRKNYPRLPDHWQQQLLQWSDRPFLEKYRYHPVTNVNYEDVTAFCSWCGGRLPNNEEWECAARGEESLLFPWGNELEPLRCNVSESGLARTSRVDENVSGTSPAGCFDMTGNVLEWVAEDKDGQYFVRGGANNYKGVPYGVAAYCMPADPDVKAPNLGFRCVL